MKISDNIIKAQLKNVYFLCGGAYGDGLHEELTEEAEFVIMDLIKLSQNQKVIADAIIPLEILKK